MRGGTLDDPAAVAPDVHIFTRSKLPWVTLPDSVPAFNVYYDTKKLWPAASLERLEAAMAPARPTAEAGHARAPMSSAGRRRLMDDAAHRQPVEETMKKITAGLFISLDGVVEAPDQWHFPYFNEEMGAAVSATFGAADTMLFGRKTYDSFAGAWPEREDGRRGGRRLREGARRRPQDRRSNQKLDFTWRNSEQLEGDLVESVTALKNEPGGTIGMSGSVSVVRQLLAAGLLDELHLLVHPIAVRKGMRLFDEGETIPLKLISSETFETGVLNLVYAPAESAGDAGYEEAKAHLPQPEDDAQGYSDEGRARRERHVSGAVEKAILAGGCFWGMQDLIRKRPGVLSTRVGYSGGDVENATYRNHGTHAEAIEITFDPEQTSYRDLLEFFFQIHDPTTLNRQGNDSGLSYRSAIFYLDDEQRAVAEDTIADVEASGLWPGKVVTEVAPAGPFWQAEPEHQDYLERYPHGYTCHFPRPGWVLPRRAQSVAAG